MRRVLRLAAACAAGLSLAGAAPAQVPSPPGYPAKPVRVIVPAAPGGGLDLIARGFTQKLPELWGQQAVVENRAGANFIVGTEAVAKAPPDGYTLLFVSSSALTINPLAYPGLPYQARDLAPIVPVTSGTFVLVANAALPAASVQELLAHLRANPGKLFHASNSASTLLASELFKAIAKVDYADINYKGGSLAAASTAAGETQFAIVDMGSATMHMRSGRVRALAVTPPTRRKLQPDVPTLAESGLPGYSITPLTLLFAPAKTSPELIARINADMLRVMALPDVIARIEANGSEVAPASAEEAARLLRVETEQWARLVKERNIRLQ
jgi:tripartite-type tricarboxylate transporter receptor subunit TctC